MDIDVFPNSLEYWGPNGMIFFRNVQVSLDTDPRRQQRRHRFGAARRHRRPGSLFGSYRTAVSQAPIQMAGRDRPRPAGPKVGLCTGGRHIQEDCMGGHKRSVCIQFERYLPTVGA